MYSLIALFRNGESKQYQSCELRLRFRCFRMSDSQLFGSWLRSAGSLPTLGGLEPLSYQGQGQIDVVIDQNKKRCQAIAPFIQDSDVPRVVELWP